MQYQDPDPDIFVDFGSGLVNRYFINILLQPSLRKAIYLYKINTLCQLDLFPIQKYIGGDLNKLAGILYLSRAAHLKR